MVLPTPFATPLLILESEALKVVLPPRFIETPLPFPISHFPILRAGLQGGTASIQPLQLPNIKSGLRVCERPFPV